MHTRHKFAPNFLSTATHGSGWRILNICTSSQLSFNCFWAVVSTSVSPVYYPLSAQSFWPLTRFFVNSTNQPLVRERSCFNQIRCVVAYRHESRVCPVVENKKEERGWKPIEREKVGVKSMAMGSRDEKGKFGKINVGQCTLQRDVQMFRSSNGDYEGFKDSISRMLNRGWGIASVKLEARDRNGRLSLKPTVSSTIITSLFAYRWPLSVPANHSPFTQRSRLLR